jgi:hypothetical protein
MKLREGETRSQYLKRVDRRTIKVLIALVIISASIDFFGIFMGEGMINVSGVIVATINLSLIIVGMVAWISRDEMGLIRTSRFFKWSVLFALAGGALLTVYYLLVGEIIWIGIGPGGASEIVPTDPLTALFIFGTISFGIWGAIIGFTSIGFGVVWITTLISRRLLPWSIDAIRSFTGESDDPLPVKLVAWFVRAPDVLDSSKLTMDELQEERKFPSGSFIRAVGWVLLIGTVVAVYFSLNPLVYENIGIVEAMSILGTISIIIPAIVIPWFAIKAMRVRIPGIKKDFFVCNGIRSRILQTFVALGTLALLIWFALEEISTGQLLEQFFYYYLTLSLLAILFTFVYFNYFEGDLVWSIHRRYEGGPDDE